jgi:hypothetical protein
MHLVGLRVFRRQLLLLLVRVLLRALRAATVVGVGCAGLVRGLGLRVCGFRIVGRLRRLLLLLDRQRLILTTAIVRSLYVAGGTYTCWSQQCSPTCSQLRLKVPFEGPFSIQEANGEKGA